MMDFRPFEEMVRLFRHPMTKPRVQADILFELCSYLAPKLKHIEMSSDTENPFVINLNLAPGKKAPEQPERITEVPVAAIDSRVFEEDD